MRIGRLALAVLIGALSVPCLAGIGQSVCLEETGIATGEGIHTMELVPGPWNLTAGEGTYLLGPAYGYNVSRSGLVTFENGSTWQVIECRREA
jgi:hypothetical protein